MTEFKIGEFITGTNDNKYGCTNANALMIVTEIFSNKDIEVHILSSICKADIGYRWNVESSKFKATTIEEFYETHKSAFPIRECDIVKFGIKTKNVNTTKEIRLEGLMDFRIKDYKVINNKVVVVEFTDGDVQKAVCMPEDEFSLDQGIEVCVMKHICGGKAKYYKVLKEAQKQIIELDETAKKKAEEEKRLAQKQEKDNAKRAARRERARQARIAEQKEAYLLALKEYNGDVNKVVEAVESEN